MNLYIYETESIAFEGGCVEVVIIIAENREVADEAMLKDSGCWVSSRSHLNNVYKVEEKPLSTKAVIFRGKVLERLDSHEYYN